MNNRNDRIFVLLLAFFLVLIVAGDSITKESLTWEMLVELLKIFAGLL